jgi:hypothetical protein
MNQSDTGATRISLTAALVLFLASHIFYITAPPNGYHKWRESDTASVTLNYYQDKLPFLTPRTNELSSSAKMTVMELPLYSFLAAQGYRLFGNNHFAAHLLTVLAGLICLWLLYLIVKILFDRITAALAVWAMAFAPLFFYYNFKIMPDILMLCFGLAGIYGYLCFLEKKHLIYLLLSALALALAACLKPLILSVFLPLLYLTWKRKERRGRNLLLFVIYIVLSLIPLALWVNYSGWLIGRSGAVGIFYRYLNLLFFKRFFLQWPFELWIGWVLVPAYIWGLVRLFKERKAGFYMVWLLASLVAVVMVARYSQHHDYYSLIFVPPLAIITGLGLKVMLFEKSKVWRWVALVLMVLAPFGAYLRIENRIGGFENFYVIRDAADRVIPKNDKVIVQDITRGAERLYELNRKGWYVRDKQDLVNIDNYIKAGAVYLVLDEPMEEFDDSLKYYFSDCVERIGPLYCYPLKKDSDQNE